MPERDLRADTEFFKSEPIRRIRVTHELLFMVNALGTSPSDPECDVV